MATPRTDSSTAPERSLNHQVVLDEDEYTEALSRIIARDFFPSLVHLDATNGYLDALNSRDPHLISASVRRLEEINTPSTRRAALYQTPSQTPYGAGPSDTPLRTPRCSEPPMKRARYDTEMSLDTFQARYTSEDNSSFTHILDEENRQRKEKWAWAWEAQKRVEQQKDRMLEVRERMLIEAPPMTGMKEKFMIEAPTPAGLITDGSNEKEGEENGTEEHRLLKEESQSQLILKGKMREQESQVDVMAPKKDARSAGVDGWKFKARNSLMFSPDADSSPYHQTPRHNIVPKGEEKSIQYGSTRLPQQDSSVSSSRPLSAPSSPTRSTIDAAIQGTPYRAKEPTINKFSLVPHLPSPTPSELGPAAVKELMTWGTLDATPRIISQSDDPAEELPAPSTPFHIPAPSSREVISHKLSNKASKSLRAKAGLLGLSSGTPLISRTPIGGSNRKGSMGPPAWTPRRSDIAGNLTPAAKRLLDRTTMGAVASRRAEAMERTAGWDGNSRKAKDMSRVRWTPTPSSVARR